LTSRKRENISLSFIKQGFTGKENSWRSAFGESSHSCAHCFSAVHEGPNGRCSLCTSATFLKLIYLLLNLVALGGAQGILRKEESMEEVEITRSVLNGP